MKIKQQKQIKTFLTEEYGNEKGSALFDRWGMAGTAVIFIFSGNSKADPAASHFSIFSHCKVPAQVIRKDDN